MNFCFSDRMSEMKGSAIREIFKLAGDPAVISLAGGNPAPELFPNKELAAIAAKLLEEKPVLSLQYGVTEGYAPLREQAKARIREKEGIDGENDELIITSGGQQGIELIAKCLVNEGDAVIVEEPSFIGATNAFRSFGAKLIGVGLENDGIDLDKLEKALDENKNVRIMYLIPTFQNPAGTTTSLEKRKAIYALAKKHSVLIIEDNPYGELRFAGEHVPTIKSMDTDGIVAYCGSFSKIISPGLRVGFLCAPKELVAKAVVAKQVSDVHTAMLPQLLVSEFMKRYDIDSFIKKNRELYGKKCALMLEGIEACFPGQVTHTTPQGGLFVWCDMNGDFDTAEIAKAAVKKNVVFVPGSTFMADMSKPRSTFRLNYSSMSDEKITKGVEILGKVLKEYV
ncbi:MAG: PLP-dependent aminotransferase family protein [Clostridia bacterium]|nr:PLP-dependent aminotransferase family protein [Clostridia bacterium]